jgi:tRNA U38,U39,U40 pseudouridine synthase TruA
MVGRSSPTSPPSRAHSPAPSTTSPAKTFSPRAQAALTPESTPSPRSPPSPSPSPSPPSISTAPSTALSPQASASSPSKKSPKTSTPATAPSAKPTSTASSPATTTHYSLNLDILQQAATHILGTHDFTSFAANDPDQTTRTTPTVNLEKNCVISTEAGNSLIVRSAVERPPHFAVSTTDLPSIPSSLLPTPCLTRTIYHSAWHQQDDLLIYRITGNGFLHHMVRNLVGTFVEAAANRISPDAIPEILAARNRSAAGPTAPASGLFLVEVEYE